VIDVWRRIDGLRALVIFEAVGMPGMIEQALRMAPRDARVLVVGVCMQEDRIHPMVGIGRELNIQFALAYEPLEFAAALRSIAEGAVDLAAEPELSLWDMAAVAAIVVEAGGRFTGLNGVDGVHQGNAAASNGLLHEAFLDALGSRQE
jgi:threonine dehydrogenase-like Zn-dependent dehydrogenase